MSLFKGYKIDYDRAEADTKLSETNERRKRVRAECYEAINKKLNEELSQIRKTYPNCVAEEVTSSSEFADADKDCIFSFSHTQKFEGYVINKYLVTNEVNYEKDCYEDNYHEKLEWSYGLSETVEASYVIFKSEEDKKNYIDIGKYIKLKNFSKEEFVENDKILKNESAENLQRDKDNIENAKKRYNADKNKYTALDLINHVILLSAAVFYILASVSLFLVCYGAESNPLEWFIELPYFVYIIIWCVCLIEVIVCSVLLRHTSKSSIGYLVLIGIATVIMISVSLNYDYFTGEEADAIKWFKVLAYASAIMDLVALLNAVSPITPSLAHPEKTLQDREEKYKKALEYINDPINKKCIDLLAERETYIVSHGLLKKEKKKAEIQEKRREEQDKIKETEELLRKFEGSYTDEDTSKNK